MVAYCKTLGARCRKKRKARSRWQTPPAIPVASRCRFSKADAVRQASTRPNEACGCKQILNSSMSSRVGGKPVSWVLSGTRVALVASNCYTAFSPLPWLEGNLNSVEVSQRLSSSLNTQRALRFVHRSFYHRHLSVIPGFLS